VHKRIISAVKRIEFVSDMMAYIVPRACCEGELLLGIGRGIR
jgi:hypothetical protein